MAKVNIARQGAVSSPPCDGCAALLNSGEPKTRACEAMGFFDEFSRCHDLAFLGQSWLASTAPNAPQQSEAGSATCVLEELRESCGVRSEVFLKARHTQARGSACAWACATNRADTEQRESGTITAVNDQLDFGTVYTPGASFRARAEERQRTYRADP